MRQWLLLLFALLLSGISVWLSVRLRRLWWLCVLIGWIGIACSLFVRHFPSQADRLILSATIPLAAVPLVRFPLSVLTRSGLIFAAMIVTISSGWMPFIAAVYCRAQLSQLQTIVMPNGICLQTTDYTCGPAAAVTSLRSMNLPAEEGELGLLAGTSSHGGTRSIDLADAIVRRFGKDGVRASRFSAGTPEELQPFSLTVIQLPSLIYHWVTVLDIGRERVRYADPLRGMRLVSREEFEREWRKDSVRIWRE